MSAVSRAACHEPLTQLVRDLAEWLAVLRRFALRRRGEAPDDPDRDVRASDESEQFRAPAKAIIVWLELHARDADAAEVDDAMAVLRENARRFDTGGLTPVLDERADEYVSPLELLIEAAEKTAGRLDDLDQARARAALRPSRSRFAVRACHPDFFHEFHDDRADGRTRRQASVADRGCFWQAVRKQATRSKHKASQSDE